MTIEFCRICGEYAGLHTSPCTPGECTSAGCHEIIVDDDLGLCGVHLAMVKSQRTSRSTEHSPRSRAVRR